MARQRGPNSGSQRKRDREAFLKEQVYRRMVREQVYHKMVPMPPIPHALPYDFSAMETKIAALISPTPITDPDIEFPPL